jgi:methyl-accepting chemotaxis protein
MVFLKGGTDDMYNFARNFSDIAMDMKGVSDTISDVVQDVANGAVYQADETVNAVGILDNDIRDINQLAEQEENSREQLERAVENIQTSSQNVRHVSDVLVEVKDNFSAVNEQSANLVQSADDILQISAAVEDIAEKINLLSLNASIEAARAGEAGKGFAVVAGEVRKLAETSKRSAQSISSSLQLFVQQINNLAEQIAAQFHQIDESNKLLQDASSDTMNAADNIQAVSQQIASLVDRLFNETKQLSKVFDNIQSLAAIAEQNSASSEEMSANVTTYSNKIKELMDYINQLEELTASFKEQLEEYRI